MQGYKKKLGEWGEELASRYLERRGCRLIETNWQKRCGEIDLIMEKSDVNPPEIVFVEVKTRASGEGWGEEAVNYLKKRKIKRTIDKFISANKKFQQHFPRFDIVVVELDELTPKYVHFENVELVGD